MKRYPHRPIYSSKHIFCILSVTIYDIAKEAGVSIATVSRVFNNSNNVSEKARTNILSIAKRMGYHPQAMAQGLARKKSKLISVIVPVISNHFFMEVLEGIQDEIAKTDYDLNIYNIKLSDDIFEQVENSIKRGMAEGYLIISVHLLAKQWKELRKLSVPITVIDEYSDQFDSISVDSVQGGQQATEYLLEKGFRRIAMISADTDSKPAHERLNGYKNALEKYGISIEHTLISNGSDPDRDGFTERNGYEAMMKLLKLNPLPDACFCNSDVQAIGAAKAMQDLNTHIPLIGFDDIQFSDFFGLSTMRQPMRQMGKLAVKKLVKRIDTPDTEISNTVFSPELVLRGSTESEKATAQTKQN